MIVRGYSTRCGGVRNTNGVGHIVWVISLNMTFTQYIVSLDSGRLVTLECGRHCSKIIWLILMFCGVDI